VSGRKPPLRVQHGASAIHSAEVRCAPLTLDVLLNVSPELSSVMLTVNFEPL
jgi:hypothetical protein